jgi:processive 1,2-diacylglycerol beta-glucosyltransferase
MVKLPRFGRLRLPQRLTQRWRAGLSAQRRWWRARRRAPAAAAGGAVLFPAAGRGAIAVETLAGPQTAAPTGPRIAILHATAGSGHKRAAESLAAALSHLQPSAIVREVDTLVFASRLYRGTYAASYNAMAARAPGLWGVLYHSWAAAPVNRSTAPVRLALDRLNLRRLVRVVERESPDAVICTHFLPVEALSPRRGGGRLRVPLYCVITDFAAHPFWAFPHVDRYFVANPELASEMTGLGVPSERIEVTGIPVDPKFARTIGRTAARERFGLDPERPVVLVMGGGSGVGPLAEVAVRLSSLAARPAVLVMCGMNRRLRAKIDSLPEARAGLVRALGFTRDVDVLFEACDLAVGKAGGLTCAEALAKGIPLVIFKPTPGQEVRNARYLEAAGAAFHADSDAEVEEVVGRLLADDGARAQMRESAARIAAPHAAEIIARRVLADIGASERLSA